MDSDKGLLVAHGITWAERSQGLLTTVCDRVVFSMRADQQHAYGAAIHADASRLKSQNIPVLMTNL